MRSGLCVIALATCALASPAVAKEISGAFYSNPTSEYPHGVLGDDEEWRTLNVEVKREKGQQGGLLHGQVTVTYQIEALEDMVYEDIEPRLWDVTGDGSPEVVVVAAHQATGAQLVIIGLEDGELTYLATTPTIGTRFRWLAPVAAADFDGDGHIEIAYVDRPHLAKTLRVWRYTPDSFEQIATLQGVTNHRIGEDFITGGLRDCGAGPEMIVVDARWQNIMAARLTANDLTATPIGPFDGPASVEAARACN